MGGLWNTSGGWWLQAKKVWWSSQPVTRPGTILQHPAIRVVACCSLVWACRWYDPLKKETQLNAPAIKKWLGNGALPSDTVRSLLKKAYVIEPQPVKVEVPKGAVPKL
jgi:hypothetical protein